MCAYAISAKISCDHIIPLLQVSIVNGTGKFFVGLLSYDNTGNLAYNGSCCDGVKDVNGSCVEFCDLVFDIKVYGLDKYVKHDL